LGVTPSAEMLDPDGFKPGKHIACDHILVAFNPLLNAYDNKIDVMEH